MKEGFAVEKNIISVSNYEIPFEELLNALHMSAEDDMIDSIAEIHRSAAQIAKPVAIYMPVVPRIKGGEMFLNGVNFNNRFVYDKLSNCSLVAPYVVSCGREIDEWSKGFGDLFEQFAADTLKQIYLKVIREKLINELANKHFTSHKKISWLSPGSLKEWPVSAQVPLFELLGGVTNDIGVELKEDSLLMLPTKSASGIMFESNGDYENCRYCPRLDCPNRRAGFEGEIDGGNALDND